MLIYAVASCISLFSLDAAFVIDLVRDLYEAFVIYCLFNLFVEYLGGALAHHLAPRSRADAARLADEPHP